MRINPVLSIIPIALWVAFAARAETIALADLDLKLMTTGWGHAQADKSVTGRPLRIGTQTFARGVGTHAESEFHIDLGGRAERFHAAVGVDAAAGSDRATVEFLIYGDDRELWRSGLCKLGEPARTCELSLDGVRVLTLLVMDGGDRTSYDHADWADARITYRGDPPRAIPTPPDEPVILTPPAPAHPRINGPKVYGVRPGSPFLYRVPATGERPMTFAAEGLPPGLALDAQTGIITGAVAERGEHRVTLAARNARGEARREFRIVVGDRLALTPPMGWNSWYIHYTRVSDAIMRAAADAMISSGMADYGYQYVNIDDGWMNKPGATEADIAGSPRDAEGRILPNQRFPDMKALTDYIHSKGLKAGIYTSPGPRTCARYEGSFGHEAQDARTFAEWGFDFLKYDWCTYGNMDAPGMTRDDFRRPYRLMWDVLQTLDRDIVFNLCQYGRGNVWEWGAEFGHCWRTTGDLGAAAGQLSRAIYRVGLLNAELARFAGPGHWNDPDYILIGWIGDSSAPDGRRPTPLTPNEQYTHVSMWCLMAAPLIFSGDMTRLDPFTLSLLCNHEVIEVDQDPLGKQAAIVRKTADELVLAKELENGARAVGLFNLAPVARRISISWSAVGLSGPQRVRDLWRQKDLEGFENGYEVTVARHGVALVRVRPAAP